MAFLLLPTGLFNHVGSSAAGSITFSTPVNLSNDSNQAHYPFVAAVGSNVYVAWTEESHGVYFRASHDNGSTWNPPLTSPGLKLSNVGGVAAYPVVAANGSNVYVTWAQSMSAKNETIFFASSNNNGASFHPVIVLSNEKFNSITPVLAQYGNSVYVAWNENYQSSIFLYNQTFTFTDKSIFVTASTDNGQHWTTPYNASVPVDALNPLTLGDEPQLAAWGKNAYLEFDAGGAPEEGVYITVSTNQGATWAPPTTLMFLNQTGALDREPWIAASGSNVYATWNSNSGIGSNNPGSYNAYVSVSNDNGTTFSAPLNLYPSGMVDWEAQVAAQGNSAYITFRDHTSATRKGDVFFLQSNDAGHTWSPAVPTTPPLDLSNDNGITGWANGIAVSGNTIGLGYLSYCATGQQSPSPNSGPGDCGVFGSYSSNNGASFSPETNVSNDKTAGPITDIASSTVAASGPYVYLAWQDESKSTFQVYFSETSGQLSGPPPAAKITTSPTKGAVGTLISISGANFKPASPITLKVDGVAVTSTLPATILTDASGSFSSASFSFPAAANGVHTITATDGVNTAAGSMTVVPKLSEKPVSAKVGTTPTVTVTGTGFSSGATLSLTFNGAPVTISPTTTNSTGSFVLSYQLPAGLAVAKYSVVVTDSHGVNAKATFSVHS